MNVDGAGKRGKYREHDGSGCHVGSNFRQEIYGKRDEDNNEYEPIINNYMSYYKPCYMKPYLFTDGQYDVIYNASK